jgi:hypothetical protein
MDQVFIKKNKDNTYSMELGFYYDKESNPAKPMVFSEDTEDNANLVIKKCNLKVYPKIRKVNEKRKALFILDVECIPDENDNLFTFSIKD